MSIFYPYVASSLSKSFAFRSDGAPTAPTYFPWDFDGLKYEPFSFLSRGWVIRGYRYSYGKDAPKGLIVFHHGLGAGHFSYTALIYDLAKLGYLVYAYDNIGCSLSEGETIENMGLSAITQKDFFDYLETDPKAIGLKRYCVGHSWGGWTAFCALNGNYGVSKVISIAGFTSLLSIYCSKMGDKKKINGSIKEDMLAYQRRRFGQITNFNALKALKDTDIDVLYIQGDHDKMVPYIYNGKVILESAKENKHIKVLIRKGMNHDPHWTMEGEKYYLSIMHGKEAFTSRERKKNVTYNRKLLTENDPEVMKAINDFLAE